MRKCQYCTSKGFWILNDGSLLCQWCHLPNYKSVTEEPMKDKTLEKDKVLTISKKAVLECAEECEDFKRIAQKLWPDELEKECKIMDVKVRPEYHDDGWVELPFFGGHSGHVKITCVTISDQEHTDGEYMAEYRTFARYTQFRILKK